MKILILEYSDLAIRKVIPAIKKLKKVKFDVASNSKAEQNIGHDKWFRNYDNAINCTDDEIVYISQIDPGHQIYPEHL